MTNDTNIRKELINLCTSHILTHLIGFMEIFQDGALSNLEYHLFQVIWCVSTSLGKCIMTNDTYSRNRHISVGIGHIWIHVIEFHGNIRSRGISQIEISMSSSDLV